MKERPIIFSTELIPKILDGSKTNTRRLNGLKEINEEPDRWVLTYQLHVDRSVWTFRSNDGLIKTLRCPYGQVGDRLWVREAWSDIYCFRQENMGDVVYKADYPPQPKSRHPFKWKSPIHMPRWASRITLEITNIRVERLKEITIPEAAKEGFAKWGLEHNCNTCDTESRSWFGAISHFREVWNSLNPKYSWESNPWVWVIEFKKI